MLVLIPIRLIQWKLWFSSGLHGIQWNNHRENLQGAPPALGHSGTGEVSSLGLSSSLLFHRRRQNYGSSILVQPQQLQEPPMVHYNGKCQVFIWGSVIFYHIHTPSSTETPQLLGKVVYVCVCVYGPRSWWLTVGWVSVRHNLNNHSSLHHFSLCNWVPSLFFFFF